MNLPNKLTVFRIILIPIFIIIMVIPYTWGTVTWFGTSIAVTRVLAAIIFAVASLTDLADGKIARHNHLVTNFGKFADPLADKMLVMSAFIILVSLGKAPAWVIAIIVCRELAITGLRLLIVENNGQVMAAAMPGKIKTTSQMVAIILLILNNVLFTAIHIPMATIMLYICLFFTIYSGIDYFVQNRNVFADGFK
ncbi:CDP-diacylglycerol--glycerol-3-phosphate 3-phosphatidyltransferase [Pediococcus ethanolidurans]|uniref:CDP-diacylglycerol--glycerol-3-phosphate 3-phosphatidyltransferase n=1 Tax=Pediococcus ethanolidurans TaxID=319653 RepID=UPI0021E938EA|nr:CDP-diacylglycerol--glycerol-3-phosphate 3-phosphatidyltransferase [Pediococcus ethanolidurans]MCV3314467.1 CDP-diacylglycerol--glycerol-3-phosphate 3-phosphatidyltransferase [Pediococcus ethanolidurans]MCV3326953.1 CDP-diacylglycerol--glycerol-3-phosphate 3-phosphatidyltransferase [Pediococcus ethanolidurans]